MPRARTAAAGPVGADQAHPELCGLPRRRRASRCSPSASSCCGSCPEGNLTVDGGGVRAEPHQPRRGVRPLRLVGDGPARGLRPRRRLAARRRGAAPAGSDHGCRTPSPRRRSSTTASTLPGQPRRAHRPRRHLRRDARPRAAHDRRGAPLRRQRLARAAHTARDHPHDGRGRAGGSGGARRRRAPRSGSARPTTVRSRRPRRSWRWRASGAARALETETVDLAALVGEAVDDVRTDAAARGIRLDTSLRAGVVTGDRTLLEQLAANLMHNAIVHNIDGGWVRVSCQRPTPGRRSWRWRTAARCCDPAVVGTLTEPFVRGAGRARSSGRPRRLGPRARDRRVDRAGARRHARGGRAARGRASGAGVAAPLTSRARPLRR